MNCLYITLFFKIVASVVQTFIKSWNQLLYPRVIEVCLLPRGEFRPRQTRQLPRAVDLKGRLLSCQSY